MKRVRLIFLLILITSCNGRTPQKAVPVIDLQNPAETKELYLSELLDDIRIVKLETADEILLGQNTNYAVGERFIITIDNEKILQFSNNGRYLRTIAKAGKGPEEFLRVDAYALDNENDILYINHRGDSHNILVFDLKTGERIKRIPTGVDNLISQIIVSGDSLLTIVPRMNKKYNLYTLSTSGNIIDGIAPPGVKNIGLQTSIDMVMNDLYYMPKEYDTLYTVNQSSCKPYCFFYVDDRFTYENNEIGNFVYLSANAPGFIIAAKAHSRIHLNDDGETFSMNADKLTRYLINKKDFTVVEIKNIQNDFLGFDEAPDQWDDYLFITNNLGYVCYSSFELKQKIEKALESDTLDETVKQRISAFNSLINENDNPVLVIGRLKSQ
ncbi:MAG: 6-bladed beta-propeller [Bacteroidales bacterium]